MRPEPRPGAEDAGFSRKSADTFWSDAPHILATAEASWGPTGSHLGLSAGQGREGGGQRGGLAPRLQ